RGTFANIRLRNFLVGQEGGLTKHLPSGEAMSIYDAAMRYQQEGAVLCVLAGKEYGTGSSRDWAAKGTLLLGVRFVLAESYERIHRSNLVGMGVLPLQFLDGQTRDTLGLTGTEIFDVAVDDRVQPRQRLTVTAMHPENGKVTTFVVLCRIDTPVEVDYYRNGGILQTVLRKLLMPGAVVKPAEKPATGTVRVLERHVARQAKAKPIAIVKPAARKAAKALEPAKVKPTKAKPVAKKVTKKAVVKAPVKKAPVEAPAKKAQPKKASAKKAPPKKAARKPVKKVAAKPVKKPAANVKAKQKQRK
ncbi:MAG: hypothetical protein ABIP94_00580, partial [Planctomycetota bacterium]